MSRRAFTLIELLVVIAIIATLCICLLGDGAWQALVALGAGWLIYPWRLAQDRVIDWPNTLICAMCLLGLTVGVHLFGRSFAAQWPMPRTLKLIGILMLMFLAGITAIGVTHEIYWMATSTEPLTRSRWHARTQSMNNLKQIGLAAHNHADIHKDFPAGATLDKNGAALHGWQTFLLPYIEQEQLFKKIDLTRPWNDAKNAEAMKQQSPVFLHPAVDPATHGQSPEGFALSHYAGNVHVLGGKATKFDEITDGLSNTLLAAEVATGFKPWGMPMNVRDPGVGLNAPHGFGTPRGEYVVLLLADGTVRAVKADISPAVLKALATPRGGEKVELPD